MRRRRRLSRTCKVVVLLRGARRTGSAASPTTSIRTGRWSTRSQFRCTHAGLQRRDAARAAGHRLPGSTAARCPTRSTTGLSRTREREVRAVPRGLHLRGPRPDPRLVLLAARDRDLPDRRSTRNCGRTPNGAWSPKDEWRRGRPCRASPRRTVSRTAAAPIAAAWSTACCSTRAARRCRSGIGNIVVPAEAIAEHGADAVRWSLLAGGAAHLSRRYDDSVRSPRPGAACSARSTASYDFLALYARTEEWTARPRRARSCLERPALDRWILARAADAAAGMPARRGTILSAERPL